MSSDIYSRPIDFANYGLVYAGAQKNLGAAGTTLVVIRDDIAAKKARDLPLMQQYSTFAKDESRPSPEFMKIHPRLAPIKAGIFPLVAKDGMPEIAEKLHTELTGRFWRSGAVEMDEKQSIGKRYARMDEAGTPYCITIDTDTLTGQTVTIRDRDTAQQEKVALDKVGDWVAGKLGV